MYGWQEYMIPNLKYKRPCLVNEHVFRSKPSPNGTMPDSPYLHNADLSSDSCSDDEEESKVETDDTDTLEMLKKNPLPPLIDSKKLDKIFILPIFCKPGTH